MTELVYSTDVPHREQSLPDFNCHKCGNRIKGYCSRCPDCQAEFKVKDFRKKVGKSKK